MLSVCHIPRCGGEGNTVPGRITTRWERLPEARACPDRGVPASLWPGIEVKRRGMNDGPSVVCSYHCPTILHRPRADCTPQQDKLGYLRTFDRWSAGYGWISRGEKGLRPARGKVRLGPQPGSRLLSDPVRVQPQGVPLLVLRRVVDEAIGDSQAMDGDLGMA